MEPGDIVQVMNLNRPDVGSVYIVIKNHDGVLHVRNWDITEILDIKDVAHVGVSRPYGEEE